MIISGCLRDSAAAAVWLCEDGVNPVHLFRAPVWCSLGGRSHCRGKSGRAPEHELMLRKASVARVNRRLRRYYLIVRLLPNVFALACLPLGSI